MLPLYHQNNNRPHLDKQTKTFSLSPWLGFYSLDCFEHHINSKFFIEPGWSSYTLTKSTLAILNILYCPKACAPWWPDVIDSVSELYNIQCIFPLIQVLQLYIADEARPCKSVESSHRNCTYIAADARPCKSVVTKGQCRPSSDMLLLCFCCASPTPPPPLIFLCCASQSHSSL